MGILERREILQRKLAAIPLTGRIASTCSIYVKFNPHLFESLALIVNFLTCS